MNFLEYSNKNQVNIIPQESFQELTREVFNVIATNISKSLGPLGSSATILDGTLTEATKDGYSILMKYRFHNRYKHMIYNLIKAPCTKMNNTVGDGTTTSIALTNAMYTLFTNESVANQLDEIFRLPRDFTKALDEVTAKLQERVKAYATPLDPTDYETIYNIAYVVSNGNKEVSETIAKIYSENRSPYIKQKDSPTNKSYISPSEGFDYPANLIDIIFTSNEDNSTIIKDPAIMIFDHKVETDTFKLIIEICNVMRAMGKKLIIVAPQYDTYMLDTVANKFISTEKARYNESNLILAQYHTGKVAQYQTEDLCAVLKCRSISVEMDAGIREAYNAKPNVDILVESINEDIEYPFYGVIGQADEVMLSLSGDGVFKACEDIENDPHYKRTLLNAKKDLEDIISKTDEEKLSYSSKIYDANSRVLRLEMKTFIYYVGADSALQKQILWDSIEDVIKCLRSATKYGIVPGCQIDLMKSCTDLITEETDEDRTMSPDAFIASLIFQALVSVYSLVLRGPNGDGIEKIVLMKNPDADEEDVDKEEQYIINESLQTSVPFDLETATFNPDIITSVETDIMVLTVAVELVKVLISGNQCIFVDAELNDTHQTPITDFM